MSKTYNSLFINTNNGCSLCPGVYVDDILITDDSPEGIESLITKLKLYIALKDLGKIPYFLGIQITEIFVALCSL